MFFKIDYPLKRQGIHCYLIFSSLVYDFNFYEFIAASHDDVTTEWQWLWTEEPLSYKFTIPCFKKREFVHHIEILSKASPPQYYKNNRKESRGKSKEELIFNGNKQQ